MANVDLDKLMPLIQGYKYESPSRYVSHDQLAQMIDAINNYDFAWVSVRYPDGFFRLPLRLISISKEVRNRRLIADLMDVRRTVNGFEYFVDKPDSDLFDIDVDNIMDVEPVYPGGTLYDTITRYIHQSRSVKFINLDRSFVVATPIHIFNAADPQNSYVTVVSQDSGELMHIRLATIAYIIPQ